MELIDKPSLVVHPHALVGDGTTHEAATFLPSETLGAYIKRTGVIVPAGPVAVWHNGMRVPDALWRRLIPRTGDQVVIRARVLGGGGGGSKILRTVAMVALMVVAFKLGPLVGGWLNTSMGLGLSAAGAAGLGGGLIMLGGSLLINALLPPPKPTTSQLGTGAKYESSPTYAISGGRNRMRLWEPMIVVFGRHKVVPDLGAKPYIQQEGDDQYLNQVFNFGLQAIGIVIPEPKIGDTLISSYQGVQLQRSGPDGKLSLVAGNVDTIQGFVMPAGTWVSRTTSQDVRHISVEVASRLYAIGDDGTIGVRGVAVWVQYRAVGSADWINAAWTDAVYATHYWSLQVQAYGDGKDYGQIQYGSTNYAEHTEGEDKLIPADDGSHNITCKWRWKPHPSTMGQPWQGVAPDPLISHVSASPGVMVYGARQDAPIRRNFSWDVPVGQYEVRVLKNTPDVSDPRESNETAVSQILAYQTDTADYTGQARLAARIKATAQLNGAIDELNAVVSAACPLWNGSAWIWDFTSNPAWWFLWFARGKYDAAGNRVYGGGMADSQIDIEAIKAWGAWCDAKGLTFDYVLDRKISTAEMLGIIARAGRASPTWQTGKLGVIWDAADLPVVAMFGPFNMKPGSFKVDYINDGTADEIVLNFANEDRDWQMDEVRVPVPGATAANNPLQLDFEGCTNPVMAGKEANLLAASQVFHRRRVSWETDIEGWVAGRGDVVQISHDLTVWDYSGRVYGRAGNVLTLDKAIPSPGSGTMMIRGPENQMKVVSVTSDPGDVDTLTITSDMTGFPLPGDEGYEGVPAVDWAWFFGPEATPGRRFKITEVHPSEDGVKFSAIDDDAGYYASETNPYIYTPPRDGALLNGIVFSIAATESIADMAARTHNVRLAWSLSSSVPADVTIQVGADVRPTVRMTERSTTIVAKKGDVLRVVVTPVSILGKGTPKSFTYTVAGEIPAPTPPASMLVAVDGDKLRLSYPKSPDVGITGYEVRESDSGWGGTGYAFQGDALSCLVEPGSVDVPTTWYVRAINAAGLYSESSASASYTVAPPADTTSVTEVFADTSLTNATITLDWPDVDPVFGLSAYRVSYDDVVKTAKSNTITLPANWIGSQQFTIQTIDRLGNASVGFQKSITKLAPNPLTAFRAQVIDNNVLLYWTLPAKTTLPIAHVHLRKGEAWETAQDIGTKDGTFTSLQELEAGNYTYQAAVVDTDGNESTPISITAQVSQPPDFRFNASYESSFSATKSSAIVESAALVLPVNTTETWAGHFTSNGWATPQAQIDAGFPIYIQPGAASGYYEEVFDYGSILGSSQITVSIGGVALAGSPTVNPTVSVSDDGVDYTDFPGMTSVFATNFQYVKVRVAVEQNAPGDLYQINSLSARLDAKQRTDGGQVDVLSTDPAGTIANFASEFVDIESLTLTPQGTAARSAVYDFNDTVIVGTYAVASNVCTVTAAGHGLVAGQRVRLSFTSGSAPNGVYVVASVTDANTYTVGMVTANTSGAVSTYAQGMRIYLFDTAGNRVSGSVSWAARGY